MKILFMSWSMPGELNAYTHRLYKLAEGLKSYGHETEFLFFSEHPELGHTMVPAYLPKIVKRLNKFDLIHAGSIGCAFVASICKPFIKAKIIYDVHGDRIAEVKLLKHFPEERHKLGKLPLTKAIVREFISSSLANYFLVVSEPLKRKYIERGINKNKIFLMRNGVDIKLFSPGQRTSVSGPLKICYAGGYQKWQAIDDFCYAAKKFIDTYCEFHFVGFKSEDDELLEFIRSKLSEKAIFINRLPQIQLVNYLRKCDFLIIPRKSTLENAVAFPTKFAEYISIGKPVIVSRVGEIAELTKKYKCGLVCDANVRGLSHAIEKAFCLSYSERLRMGENGRKLAESFFDWSLISKKYAQIIESISANKSK